MANVHHRRSRIASGVLLAVALLCLLSAAAGRTPRVVEAAPGGQFTMSPSNIFLGVNDAIAVTIILNGGTDVHEVYFVLSYDPAVVQLLDANAGQPGVQVLQGPFPASSAPGTMLQNSASGGIITYQYVLPAGQNDAGDGTVATAQFIAIADGSANFSWQTLQIVDDAGVPYTASGTVAALLVGQDTPTPGPTDTPTITPTPSSTPVVVATDTPVAVATGTPAETATAAATSSPTLAATATTTVTATSTNVAGPTATPRITVVQDSNQGQPPQSSFGVDPAQAGRADGLPSAGSAERSIAWWRWVFFLAALMLGVAGWFFTLAVYNGNKEVVLIDRFDKRRRRG